MTDVLSSSLNIVLIAALLIVLVLARRRIRAQRTATAEERSEHEQILARTDEDHRVELSAQADSSRLRLDSAETARIVAAEEAQQARRRLARTWGSEAVSHSMIAASCASAGLTGVLATNVVFVPADAPWSRSFLAQIDHVLLTRQGAFIIENKYWQGIVFDCIAPSSVHESFGRLLDETLLTERFALQIAPADGGLAVRPHLDQDSPIAQVRRQAPRLKEYLEVRRPGLAPWFETVVLYSHSRATLYSAPNDEDERSGSTRVVAGAEELSELLAQVARRSSTRVGQDQLDEAAAVFRDLGAHVEAV